MNKLILLLCLCSLSSFAETWSDTSIQYLYGNNFDRLIDGDRISNGKMETITIEHAGGWKYGKNFFFVDLFSADFDGGKEYKLYAEWAPKLSLSKLSDTDLSWGFITDVYLAGEINQGDDFRAVNLGFAVGVDVVGFDFLDVNIFSRKDNYNDRTGQLTVAWKSHFVFLSLPLVFEGFFDYYGVDAGTAVVTQPRLLLEGKVISDAMEDLQAGIEIYYYRASASALRESVNETVPQFMLKWTW